MDKTLTPRQDSFCVHYTTIGAETYSHGTKAALAAGYSESSAHVTATKLLKQEAIRDRLVELQAENMERNMITIDKVLSDLEHDKLLARERHNYSVATRCTELQGNYLSMFTEGFINRPKAEEQQSFTPEQLAQLKHLAGLADGISVVKPDMEGITQGITARRVAHKYMEKTG